MHLHQRNLEMDIGFGKFAEYAEICDRYFWVAEECEKKGGAEMVESDDWGSVECLDREEQEDFLFKGEKLATVEIQH